MLRVRFGSEVDFIMDLISDDLSEEELEKMLEEQEKEKFKDVNFITPVVIIMHNALCFHKASFQLWQAENVIDAMRDTLDCLETDTCLYAIIPNNLIFEILYHLSNWTGTPVQII